MIVYSEKARRVTTPMNGAKRTTTGSPAHPLRRARSWGWSTRLGEDA